MMFMQAGETFRSTPRAPTKDRHLWIIASEPSADPEHVLIVNVTTYEPGKDDSCVLEAGEHPFITHKSCVRYAGANVTSLAKIRKAITDGLVETHSPVRPDILAAVRDGAARSPYLRLAHRHLLERQGLI